MSDKAFLEHVRSRMGPGPKAPHPGLRPQRDRGSVPLEHRVDRFRRELKAVGGHVEAAASPDDLRRRLMALSAELGLRTVITEGPDARFDGETGTSAGPWWEAVTASGLQLVDSGGDRSIVASADVGVTMADWAVAETGTIVQITAPGRGRIVSLLPPVHVALLPVERIVSTRTELFARFRRTMDGTKADHATGAWPSNINFITGPSRTADIESDLSIGVHGPGHVHVFLLGESPLPHDPPPAAQSPEQAKRS